MTVLAKRWLRHVLASAWSAVPRANTPHVALWCRGLHFGVRLRAAASDNCHRLVATATAAAAHAEGRYSDRTVPGGAVVISFKRAALVSERAWILAQVFCSVIDLDGDSDSDSSEIIPLPPPLLHTGPCRRLRSLLCSDPPVVSPPAPPQMNVPTVQSTQALGLCGRTHAPIRRRHRSRNPNWQVFLSSR